MMDHRFSIGFKFCKFAAHVIKCSSLNPIFARQALVTLAELAGALSCIKRLQESLYLEGKWVSLLRRCKILSQEVDVSFRCYFNALGDLERTY